MGNASFLQGDTPTLECYLTRPQAGTPDNEFPSSNMRSHLVSRVIGRKLLPAAAQRKRKRGPSSGINDPLAGLDKYRVRRASHLHTWQSFDEHMFGLEAQVFPLQPLEILKVASEMRRIGYRSVEHFILSIRRLHLEKGHLWSAALSISYKDARKVGRRRRLGQPRRSKGFCLRKVIRSYVLGQTPKTSLRLPHHALIAGAIFLFRGIELVELNLCDVNLQFGDAPQHRRVAI